MAELSITAANVVKVAGGNAVLNRGTAGATITAGQAVFIDTADSNLIKLADANDTLAKSQVAGVAAHGASTGQPIAYWISGPVTIGATVVQDMIYVVGTTLGAIMPISDVANASYASVIGRATSTTVLTIDINNATAAIGAEVT